MKSLRIGFDIDDVLINSADTSAVVHNTLYGTKLSREHNYDLSDATVRAWQVADSQAVIDRIHEILPMPEWLESAEALPDALDVLMELKKSGCELFAVTGRPASLRMQTLAVLEKCYPGLFSDETLFMTDIFGMDGTPAQKITKLDIARQLNLTHFVEDYLVHADVLGEGGITTVLFSDDYHWNRTGGHESLVRIGNWKDIGKFFDAERSA